MAVGSALTCRVWSYASRHAGVRGTCGRVPHRAVTAARPAWNGPSPPSITGPNAHFWTTSIVTDIEPESAHIGPWPQAVLCASPEPVPITESHVPADTGVNPGLARPRRQVAGPRITRRLLLASQGVRAAVDCRVSASLSVPSSAVLQTFLTCPFPACCPSCRSCLPTSVRALSHPVLKTATSLALPMIMVRVVRWEESARWLSG